MGFIRPCKSFPAAPGGSGPAFGALGRAATAKAVADAVALDDGPYIRTTRRGRAILAEASADGPLSLLHTLDDYLASARAAGPTSRGWRPLANAGGEAALEGEHLPGRHEHLSHGAEFIFPRDHEGFVSDTKARIRVPDELREHILPLAVERHGVRTAHDSEGGSVERPLKAAGACELQREETVLRAEGEHVLPIDEDVSHLARVLRNDIRHVSRKQRICGSTAELIVRGRANSQVVPVDHAAPRGPFAQFLNRVWPLPEAAERIPGARGPFHEEGLGRLLRLWTKVVRNDALGHRPHMVELERQGAPEGPHDDMDVRVLEDPGHEGRVPLGEGAVAFREDEHPLRRGRSISLPHPPPETMEDGPMCGFGSDVVQGAPPREGLGLLEEIVVAAQLANRVDEGGMGSRPSLPELPEGPLPPRPAPPP